MDVSPGAASPLFAAGNQFQLDYAFGAQKRRNFSVGILRSEWHKDSHGFLQRGQHFRPADDLGKMRRADFFFSFSHKNKIHGQLAARAADGMQRRQECRFRALSG